MSKIFEYLKYPSTYQGFIALLSAAGITLAPEYQNLIISIGLAIGGFIAVKFSDADVK